MRRVIIRPPVERRFRWRTEAHHVGFQNIVTVPVLVIDGAAFCGFEGFTREFSRLLHDYGWHGNLDAFNDILRGGFGTPDGQWTLRWLNSISTEQAAGEWAEHREYRMRTRGPAAATNRPAPARPMEQWTGKDGGVITRNLSLRTT
jgi:hypothetical protein